jgi:hypothetical protein
VSQVVKLYDNVYPSHKVYADLRKYKISTRFLEARSIPEYLENKIDYYTELLQNYQKKDGKVAKVRSLSSVIEDFKTEVQNLKEARGEDYESVDLDQLAQTSISLLDFIKVIQKDEAYIRDINKLQDSLIKDLMTARRLEIDLLDVDRVLNDVYREIFNFGSEIGKPHLAIMFHVNVRKILAEVNGSRSDVFSSPELDEFLQKQKNGAEKKKPLKKYKDVPLSKIKQHHKRVKEFATTKEIPYNLAQKVFAMRKEKPDLSDETLIQMAKEGYQEEIKKTYLVTPKPKINEE